MSFVNPLALWGLLSIPAILAMYLLKQKYRDLPVPSLFLWAAALDKADAARSFQKLRRNSLMLLQLLAAFLLCGALAGPYVTAQGRAGEILLVLDCSLSMQAADGRFLEARDEALRQVERLGPQGKAAVLVLSAEPYVASGFTDDKAALSARIHALAPTSRPADHSAAAALAMAVAAQGSPEIILLTDSGEAFEVPGYAVTRYIAGQSADNLAVTRVSARREGERISCLVQLQSRASVTVTNSLALYADDKLFSMTDISLAPDEALDLYIDNIPPGTSFLLARLSEPDALAADDTAYACVYPDTARRTILFTNRNVFLENVLAILPNVELYKGDPANVNGASGYYLYVYDGVLPDELPTDGHVLIFNPPEGNALFETAAAADVSAFTPEPAGTADILPDTAFAVLKAKTVTPPDWMEPALRAGDAVLALSGQAGGRQIVLFTFDLHDTDLPLRKEFPIFMYDLCGRFMPAEALAARELYVGEAIALAPEPDAADMSVLLPDGTSVALAPPFPAPPLTRTDKPGLYTLTQTRAGGVTRTLFAVNLLPGADSDLRRTPNVSGYVTEAAPAAYAEGSIDLTPYILAVLLLCVLAEWWLYSKQ